MRPDKKPNEIDQKASSIIDITETADYFAAENIDLAMRFLDAVEETLAQIERRPFLGTPEKFAAVPNLRMWPVHAFRKILVFYLYDDDVIEIVRVIHSARDFYRVLPEEI